MDEKFVVISVASGGPAMATHLVGKLVVEKEDGSLLISEPVRILEVMTEQGNGLQWLPETFFTFSKKPVKVPVGSIYRELDPIEDNKTISNYKNFMSQLRLAKSGLVAGNGQSILQR